MKISKAQLLNAAFAGILGASLATHSSTSQAAEGDSAEKGHCIGANSCKGHGGCAQKGKNECAGKNGCKGKGFIEVTRAECEKLAMKNKSLRFEAAKKM